jgi:hypothetical protein
MAGLAGGAAAQDEEPGLCELLDIDEFSAAVGLEFVTPPQIDRSDSCIYDAADAPEGRRSVRIGIPLSQFGTYDQRREGAGAMEPVDLTIGGRRAHVFSDTIRGDLSESVYVDLGDEIFFAQLIVEEGAVPDQRERVIELAEATLSNLGPREPAPTEPPGPPVGASGIELPEVEGFTWDEQIGARGDQLGDVDGFDVVGFTSGLLAEVGVDSAALGFLAVQAKEPSGIPAGEVLALRIDGVDPATLEQAVPEWLSGILGTDEFDTVTLAGKDVISVNAGGRQATLVYVTDDTVYLLAEDAEYTEPLLEALP